MEAGGCSWRWTFMIPREAQRARLVKVLRLAFLLLTLGPDQQPVGNCLQSGGRKSFFDSLVFGGRAGVGGLKKMIQAGKFAGVRIWIASLLQRLANQGKIQLGGNLQVFLAVKGQGGGL